MAGQFACQLVWIGKKLGRGKEEGQIVDHINMKEMLVTLKMQEYVQYWSCNSKLEMAIPYNLYLSPITNQD